MTLDPPSTADPGPAGTLSGATREGSHVRRQLAHAGRPGSDPIGRSLVKTGITPDVITVIGIVMSGVAAVTIGAGYLRVGFLFLLLTAIPDALDGAVAVPQALLKAGLFRLGERSTHRRDALRRCCVVPRSTEPGRIMMLPVAIMGLAMFISYQRAKAESLGWDAKGGIMERAERIVVLAFALLFPELLSPPSG